jgi:hypothetical protein
VPSPGLAFLESWLPEQDEVLTTWVRRIRPQLARPEYADAERTPA